MRIHIIWGILALALSAASGLVVYCLFEPTYAYTRPAQPAFVISFDDKYISEWHAHRDLFKKYDVHATFFITVPHQLTETEIGMLRELAADGHEIASHGFSHLNSSQFIKERGLEAYIANEITPAIQAMQELGFTPSTFAYPYGARSLRLDRELTKYFHLLRGDSWKVEGKGIDELNRIFYPFDGRRVIHGLGIDGNSGVSVQDLEAGFERASKKGEAIVLYAHNISPNTEGYSISSEQLEAIFKAARRYRLASLTFRDLML